MPQTYRDDALNGAIPVCNADGTLISVGGGGGTSIVDRSLFIEATSSGTPAVGIYNEILGLDPIEDQAVALRATIKRALHANLRDAAGNEIVSATGTPGGGDRGLVVRPIGGGDATAANQTTNNTRIGDITEAAPATDTASSGLNGRLQRIAQRLTSLIALLPTALISNRLDVNVGAAPAAEIGSLTEAAPGTDTASSGLNGRSQRIAQNITSLIGKLPTALGQTTMANSLAVVIASNQSAVPISATSLPLPTGAATETTLAKLPIVDKASFLDSTGTGSVILGVFNDTVGSDPLEDQAVALRSTPKRAIHVNLRNNAGTELVIPSSAQFPGALVGGRLDVNVGAINNVVPLMGDGATGTGSLRVTQARNRYSTYETFTGELTLGTAVAKNRILSFFHPVGVTLTYEILEIVLYFKATHTVGIGQYKMSFTTAESATGNVLTFQAHRIADAATGASARSATTADGTLSGNPFGGFTLPLAALTNDATTFVKLYEYSNNPFEEPLTLAASAAQGLLVYQDVTSALTTAPIVAARIKWMEY